MKKYHQMLQHILDSGVIKGDRTGTGTRSVFGYQERFDLSKGFPLLTTKKIHFKSVVHELIWLISGSTNVKYLKDNGVSIWDEWADANGELGPVYGKQWRAWSTMENDPFGAHEADFVPSGNDDDDLPNLNLYKEKQIDQLAEVIQRIKDKPDDRRLIVTAWNPTDVPKQKLPPCHAFYQFYTRSIPLWERRQMAASTKPDDEGFLENIKRLDEKGLSELGISTRKLDCHMYQRSADTFLGVPFNIASYALLTHMVAQVVGMVPGEFVHSFGDLHIYSNHFEQVNEQLSRDPRPLPTLKLNPLIKNIDDFKYEDIELIGYDPWPAIKAPVAV